MHEHQAAAAERVAVALGQSAFGAGADVSKDEGRYRLAGQTGQVGAVPGGDGRGEDARVGTEQGQQRGRSVVAHAEAITVVWAARVESKSRVVGLRKDGMRRVEDEM